MSIIFFRMPPSFLKSRDKRDGAMQKKRIDNFTFTFPVPDSIVLGPFTHAKSCSRILISDATPCIRNALRFWAKLLEWERCTNNTISVTLMVLRKNATHSGYMGRQPQSELNSLLPCEVTARCDRFESDFVSTSLSYEIDKEGSIDCIDNSDLSAANYRPVSIYLVR